MREPCYNLKSLTNAQDPFESKWLNCKYDEEPRPIETRQAIDDFKKLCPHMYQGNDHMPVCCSANQIEILKRDLEAAEAIIGSCASCYFNFRNIWCHLSCDPNQSDFIVPMEYKEHVFKNFTKQYRRHLEFKHEEQKDPAEEEPEDAEDEEEHENTNRKKRQVSDSKKRLSKRSTTSSTTTTSTTTQEHEEENNETDKYVYTVSKIAYYLKEEYVWKFIESCKDIKLYGNDALLSLCGVASKSCNPAHFASYMGLTVSERPFDIYFTYDLKEPSKVTLRQQYYKHDDNDNIEENQFFLKPMMGVYHRCNESYQYGDLDYGSKCSCKTCQASCEIYDEFLISPKRRFKIGQADGLVLIMSFLFAIFLLTFIKTLCIFKSKGKKKSPEHSTIPNGTDLKRNRIYKPSFISKMFSCCLPRKKSISLQDTADSPELSKKNNRYQKLTRRLSRLNFLDKMLYFGDKLERFIEVRFTRMGKFCATYPTLVLVIGLAFCGLMCLGYVNFKIEKDPINLWSSDSSHARRNKKYFDENFGPFYRITQMIIEPKKTVKPINYTDEKNVPYTLLALQKSILNETFILYEQINNIKAECKECTEAKNKHVKLNDICFQPLAPENKNCSTQSIFQYWQNDAQKFYESLQTNNQFSHLSDCMKNPFETYCLSAFGGPMQPYMVIGSYGNSEDYLNAGSIVTTFIVNNFMNNREELAKAMAWEAEVLVLLKNYTSDLIEVYYTTERSIEDELERESKADIKIIAISYLMMFLYLTITLGKYSSLRFKVILLEMKIFLGLAGVFLVLLSVFSSGGLFTYIGVPATLITLEVVPFLLLAVGVDNVYILVQTYQNDERLPNESIEDQIARIVGRVGPSMLLTGTTQSAAFIISALTPMPGVRAFSMYASLAIMINFVMQITCFVVLLTLDAKREQSKRVDIACCIKLKIKDSDESLNGRKSFLHKFFKNVYTPLLFNNYVRATVIVVFVGFFFACVAMCDKIKVGLDQKLTMPTDSYQIKYFEALQKHLAVGPPVYFVLKDGYNYTDTDSMRKLCGASTCESNSLQSLISSASFFPNETYIAASTVNWIDDYMEWLASKPNIFSCCFLFKNTSNFCDYKKLTDESSKLADDCEWCPVDRVKYNLPSQDSFLKYIRYFLNQNPSRDCIKAGHAMYGNAVKLITDNYDNVVRIGPSHFMAYHKVLSTSDDFVNAMVSAHQISDTITNMLNKNSKSSQKYEVFPYSIFYVFYEQYLTIWQDATMQLILTLAAIFLCTFILLSFDLFTALIVTFLIAIIIIDMVGIMFLWNIELNAISLVNLVIAIGISVEFCSHIARAFATSNGKTRKERASEALYKMGPPVFSGVLQSIVGISVLAFAHSQLFQVFYFRMYFSILVLGLTHGLIFLPVLLSYIGRSQNHLEYLRVNQNKNMELENFKKYNESSDNSLERIQNTNLTESAKLKTTKEHQVPMMSPDQDEEESVELNHEFMRLPSSETSERRAGKNKYNFFNSPKMNLRDRDRDSPISKKSMDLLLNDQNSLNENDSVNSSNNSEQASQEINETNLDEKQTPKQNLKKQQSQNSSLSSKINNFFKFSKQQSQDHPGENHRSTNGDVLNNSLNYRIKLNDSLIINEKNRTKSTSDASPNTNTFKINS